MSREEIIAWLSIALCFGAYAFFNEMRVRDLLAKLAVSKEAEADAKIVEKNHNLTDAQLDARLTNGLSRKPNP